MTARARRPRPAPATPSRPRSGAGRARAPRASSAARTTGAQALVAQLEALGVEVVFGIPGVHNLAIFDALRRSTIRTIVVRHEQTAVYAADGYARATGRLGVCVTTTGPGAANAAAAMGEARASRSPVLHISTQIESRLLEGRGGRGSLHESPGQRDLMAAVGHWSATVARAEAIPSMVARAAHEAFAGRRGPAFLDVPNDFLDAPVSWKATTPAKRYVPPPDGTYVARAAERLDAAKRPVVWAGGGAIDAADAVRAIAEALDAPIVTTFAAKGIVGGHPLAVGFPPHQPEVTAMLRASDAVLVVASDLDGPNTQNWRLPLPRPRVSINTVAEDARRNYAADVLIESDARPALEALLPLLRRRRGGGGARRVAQVRERADAALRADAKFRAPYRFVEQLAAAVPGDAFVVADMAIGGYWLGAAYMPPSPRSFAYPLGWGTLGFALPAAIGAGAAGRRTLAVCGDAGALFAIGELATAAQERLPVVVLVVNDEGYGMLRFDEQERFGDTFATDLVTPNFVATARAFGLKARAATEDDIGASLAWAFKQKAPTLVELRARWAPPLTTSPRWPLKGRKEARP